MSMGDSSPTQGLVTRQVSAAGIIPQCVFRSGWAREFAEHVLNSQGAVRFRFANCRTLGSPAAEFASIPSSPLTIEPNNWLAFGVATPSTCRFCLATKRNPAISAPDLPMASRKCQSEPIRALSKRTSAALWARPDAHRLRQPG